MMKNKSAFNAWFDELQLLSAKKGIPLEFDQESYREYFDDGDSPSETLEMEEESIK